MQLGASEVIPDSSLVTLTGTLNVNGSDREGGRRGRHWNGQLQRRHAGDRRGRRGTTTFNGLLSSVTGATLNKSGASTVILAGTSNVAGATSVNVTGGLLRVTAAGALPNNAGINVTAPGTFETTVDKNVGRHLWHRHHRVERS